MLGFWGTGFHHSALCVQAPSFLGPSNSPRSPNIHYVYPLLQGCALPFPRFPLPASSVMTLTPATRSQHLSPARLGSSASQGAPLALGEADGHCRLN